MSLTDLPPLRDSLSEHGLLADKSFGQHFLLDLNITRKITRLAGPADSGAVLLTSSPLRYFVRQLIEPSLRNLQVLAHAEVPPGVKVLSMGVVQ